MLLRCGERDLHSALGLVRAGLDLPSPSTAALSLPLPSSDSLDDPRDVIVMEFDDDVADDGDDGDEDSYADRRVEAALVAIEGAPVVVAEPETKGTFRQLFRNQKERLTSDF